MIVADVLYKTRNVFADALYERNPLVFADVLLKTWQTDTVIWHTNPQRDSDPNFPCDDCEELNGQEFDLTDLPDRPHFGCNCTLTDGTTGEELSGLEMFMRVDTGEQRHHSTVHGSYTTRKFNSQHKPTGTEGGEFTTVGGPSTPGTGNDDGRNHNPATRQNWPTRTGSGATDYTSPTHGLATPPDTRVDADGKPVANPHALDDDAKAPAGNTIRATHRRTNPNETNIDNKKLNDLIDQGSPHDKRDDLSYGQYSLEADELKNQVVTELTKRSGLSKERTSDLVQSWAASSSDTLAASVALQMAVVEQFHVKPGDNIQARSDFFESGSLALYGSPVGPESAAGYAATLADAKKFVAAMYAYTQETFAELGIKSVTVYRGVGFDAPLDADTLHSMSFNEDPAYAAAAAAPK